MQLVAYGAQDIYLTGNPQITFFKVVYRRHTNFSMESIKQIFNGSIGLNSTVSANISRNGDLVSNMYIETTIDAAATTICSNYGSALLKEVEIEIGGQIIDKHYGHWLETWAQLTEPNPFGDMLQLPAGGNRSMVNFVILGDGSINTNEGTLFQMTTCMGGVLADDTTTTERMFIPLQFWFCRNPGLALPLIALQYHEVKVKITTDTQANISTGNTLTLGDFNLWVDYIYLDTDERKRFAQTSHEYLIEQLQMQEEPTGKTVSELNFNHPIKELIWAGKWNGTPSNTSGPSTPRALQSDATDTAKLELNGHDRFAARHTHYFTRSQVLQYHSGFGGVNNVDSIAVYSFALKPEEHQPSGTCNFSRIDNAKLIFSDTPDAGTGYYIYAINYNILRIMSGMGGLAYSN